MIFQVFFQAVFKLLNWAPEHWRRSPGSYQDRFDQTWIYTKGEGWAKSTPMPKMPALSGYVAVKSGLCSYRITTKADCEAALRGMGLEWLDKDGAAEETSSGYPPYCYLYQGKYLYFNKDSNSEVKCSSTNVCICGTRGNSRGERCTG